MKIEKVNEYQIRCTLTKADLADRELKISELAYGSEKARNLFKDMIQQASYEFDFEAEDIPLMIEAVPLNSECIVLIITKVEDPEELDTRFSKFAPYALDDDDDDDYDYDDNASEMFQTISASAEDVLDLFKKIHDSTLAGTIANTIDALVDMGNRAKQPNQICGGTEVKAIEERDLIRIYTFDSLNSVMRIAHVLDGYYDGSNSLYKDEKESSYILVVTQSDHTSEDFNRVCNMLSEYGKPEKLGASNEAHLEEICETVIKDNALQVLAGI